MPTLTQLAGNSYGRGSPARYASASTGPVDYAITRLFVVLLCITRLAGITHHSLWYDEGYTLNLVNTSSFSQFLRLFSSYTLSEHLQPLYYLFMFGWSRIAGSSDVAMRLPSALFSIASGLIFLFLMKMVAPKRHGFGVALLSLFALSSYSIYYGQEARPYAMLQMLALAFIALWIDQRRPLRSVYEQRSSVSKAAFALVAVLCVLGSAFTAMVVLCVCAAEFSVLASVRRWWIVWGMPMLACSLAVIAYAVLLWTIHLPNASRDFIVIKQSLLLNIPYLFSGLIFGFTLPPGPQALHGANKIHALISAWPVLLLCLVSVCLLVLAVSRLMRTPKALPTITETFARATALYVVLLLAGFGWIGRLNVLPRHGSGLFAMLLVLVMLASIPRWKGDRVWQPVYGCAVLSVLACNLISVWGYFANPEFLKDDYRAAARLTATRQHLPVYLIEGQPALLRHYGAEAIDATEVEPSDLSRFIESSNDSGGPVRLLINRHRGYRWDHARGVSEVLASQYACSTEAQFSYMDVEVCMPRTKTAKVDDRDLSLVTANTEEMDDR